MVELIMKHNDGTTTEEQHETVESAMQSYTYEEIANFYDDNKRVTAMHLYIKAEETEKAVEDALSEIRKE